MRLVAAVFAAVLLVAGCSSGEDAVARGGDFQFVSPGGKTDIFYEGADRQALPEVSGEDLMDPNKRISVSDFAGKVVVINIWGQWCAPCRTEAPELQKVYDQTKAAGVQVLGIDVKDPDRSAPQDFMRDRGLTYPSIYDEPGRSLLGLRGYPRSVVPSTIIVDKQQRVAAIFLRDLLATDLLPVVNRLTAES
ncbi:TlpA family protein disulfide reductase [Amycolatopsis suaedae]|uniref:TlpA family protein disulfide reductase n=1 Tax=Amycolatopsis suaedae TaxID=2510978 RepID=A0A4Q7JB40_9PSEU|nr:TlpA disulfide reductase family protein [Amycolatopsis suaedae]RZQ64288.1 TlpA family protein disulfide reductase [Amycolatopsis suaedae]